MTFQDCGWLGRRSCIASVSESEMVRKAFYAQNVGDNQQWKERGSYNKENMYERENDKKENRAKYESENSYKEHRPRNERRNDRNNRSSLDINRAPIEVKLFGGPRLNIFDVNKPLKSEEDQLATWRILNEREIQLSVAHPPANYFEEMIQWTKQGKLWKFPIDNEQGLDEERGVSFAEHVFLEDHLEPWCPRKGPLRHFMELVCVGLSKNHYLSAKEKRAHIDWFRDYFAAKRDVLLETGALPAATALEGGGARTEA